MSNRMLNALFGSELRVRALGWLFSHPDEAFYITQVANATGVPVSNLSLELRKLAEVGLLETYRVGGQRYFRANRACPIFDELRSIAVKTAGIGDVLRVALGKLNGVEAAFIYGSIARGDAEAASDVDIMVIGAAGFADVIAALEGVRERLGRDVNPTAYGTEEFREKARAGGGFLSDVLAGAKIFLVGDAAKLDALVK